MKYGPKNEGEVATYTFSFIPTQSLTENQIIQIIFPDLYDPLLGYNITCSAISGISTDISCSAEDRKLSITDLTDYTPDNLNPLII